MNPRRTQASCPKHLAQGADALTVTLGAREIIASRYVLLGRFLTRSIRTIVENRAAVLLQRHVSDVGALHLATLWTGGTIESLDACADELLAVAEEMGDVELAQRALRALELRKVNKVRQGVKDAMILSGFAGVRVGRQLSLGLAGFRWEYVATPLGKIRVYHATGEGTLPPVVVLHGFGAMASDYGPLLKGLLPHVEQVFALDLPGHGMSDPLPPSALSRDGLEQAIQYAMAHILASCHSRPVLFGNSMGGLVALRLAQHHASAYRALFLASPAGAHLSEEEYIELKESFRLVGSRDSAMMLDRLRAHRSWIDPLFRTGMGAVLRQPFQAAMMQHLSHDDFFCGDGVGALSMPITVFWPTLERILPPSHVRNLKAILPVHTVFDERPDFGHFPIADHPALFNRIVVEFLKTL